MQIDHNKERELINKALNGDYVDIIEYIQPQVEGMIDTFLATPKGIELEIPKQSLMKASEKYLISAIKKYDELLSSPDFDKDNNFIKFYSWFADKGINEYAASWELMLSGHMGGCCCGH